MVSPLEADDVALGRGTEASDHRRREAGLGQEVLQDPDIMARHSRAQDPVTEVLGVAGIRVAIAEHRRLADAAGGCASAGRGGRRGDQREGNRRSTSSAGDST